MESTCVGEETASISRASMSRAGSEKATPAVTFLSHFKVFSRTSRRKAVKQRALQTETMHVIIPTYPAAAMHRVIPT